ncbi:hypothetical protein [Acidovorax radicis]|uniref:hypothetical protein n=1 Tax=Acidovorax radicis TaxID=758826 RepID=UPI0002376D11|nr:hypothetical protein [Acidovorax radicis]
MSASPSPSTVPFAPQPSASALAQALGLPVFAPHWHMPQYPDGAVGPWQMKRTGVGLDRGYHSGPCVTSGSTVLMRQGAAGGWETWMSLSPMEVESQELACRHARGHTVVMGLGMGWVAANIALQPTVERVTVVERDGDVLELFRRCRVLEGLPEAAARKVELVQADALQWQPQGAPVDFLYADIWLYLAEPQTLAEVQRMQANVLATQVYFWGQELVLGAMACAQAEPNTPAWADAVDRAVRETGLPLLAQAEEGYANLIARVLQLRQGRQSNAG